MITWGWRRFARDGYRRFNVPIESTVVKNFRKIANRDPTGVFDRTVMEGEKCIHHYNPLSQQEAKNLKKSSEKTSTRLRVTRSAGKIIMIVFWDCEGIFLVNSLPHSTVIIGPYDALLLHRLRDLMPSTALQETHIANDSLGYLSSWDVTDIMITMAIMVIVFIMSITSHKDR